MKGISDRMLFVRRIVLFIISAFQFDEDVVWKKSWFSCSYPFCWIYWKKSVSAIL